MLNEFLVQALKMIKCNQPESQAAKMESAEGVKYQHNFNFLFAAKQRFGWYIRLSLSSALTVHQMTRTQGQDVRAIYFIEMLGQRMVLCSTEMIHPCTDTFCFMLLL